MKIIKSENTTIKTSLDASSIPADKIRNEAKDLIDLSLKYNKTIIRSSMEIVLAEYLRNFKVREGLNEIISHSSFYSFPNEEIEKEVGLFLNGLGIPGSVGSYDIYRLLQNYLQDDKMRYEMNLFVSSRKRSSTTMLDSFCASQKLIDILLENVFIEKTRSQYPDHWYTMQKEEYDPDRFKRCFEKAKMYVLFDYVNIKIFYNSQSPFFEGTDVKLEELTSIIYFSNYSKDRHSLRKRSRFKIQTLYSYFSNNQNYILCSEVGRNSFLRHRAGLEELLEKLSVK